MVRMKVFANELLGAMFVGLVLFVGLMGYRAVAIAPEEPKLGRGLSPNDPIDCLYVKRLVVVDSKGEERIALKMFHPTSEYPVLTMRNSQGVIMAELSVSTDTRGGHMIFSNAEGRPFTMFPETTKPSWASPGSSPE